MKTGTVDSRYNKPRLVNINKKNDKKNKSKKNKKNKKKQLKRRFIKKDWPTDFWQIDQLTDQLTEA